MRHVRRLVAAVFLGVMALLMMPGSAAAAGEAVAGRLVNGSQPITGATITVSAPAGTPLGSATTDAEGRWRIAVPGSGEYTVKLDVESLPDEVSLTEGSRSELTLTVADSQVRTVIFRLGKGTRVVQSDLERLPQLALDGLNFGLIIALAAVGLSLIYGTTGLVNFAHGELITVGALLAYFFHSVAGVPFLLAATLAVATSALLGGAQDRVLWRPLRRRGTGLIAMLVVTIGLALFARGLFLYLFGGSSRSLGAYQSQSGVDLGPVSMTPRDLIAMAICVLMLLAVGFALLRTRFGKATRAVSDNPALAASSGIDVERVISVVWVSGAGLAALAGVILAVQQQASFQLGFQILLLVFAGVTLGGLGTAFGALVGSLVVGVFTQVSTLFIAPELKNAGALAILILILLFRPQGILGRPERVG